MTIDLFLPLVAGFLASFHCMGMCGPIVTGVVVQRPIAINLPGASSASIRFVQSISSHVYYNVGRVLSYGTVGAIAGALGSVALINIHVQQIASIVFGVAMIVMGLVQLDIIKKRRNTKESKLHRIFSAMTNSPGGESRFLVGMLTPLLPCGLLYGMAAQSAAIGSPVTGALTMAVFALGGIPALVVTGVAASLVSGKLRRLGTHFASLLIIVMGLLTIARGFGISTPISLPGAGQEHLCGMSIG